MAISTTLETLADTSLLRASGRLDGSTSPQLEKNLLPLLAEPGSKVLLDLAELDYVSSAGLRIILMAAKRAKQAGGRFVLCGLQPQVSEVFEMSGFTRILELAASVDEGRGRLAG
ncbi:STAS domain-containing protein [Chitinilyticum piscinae]|uniref:Anti-sigma factor antagonist n=1 Tax=Chitinilyticum piscinae TaxID=2866724 RepID=A0A8J7FGZ4_9NEIS|nr:STAS domain-containing protein [Chitinilyticum piscinae]MBE9607995.1 STAS domain-containing protein [Chitinilyticum piscinae]